MFISWCANKAGILGSLVSKFAGCAYGADWYRSKGRFVSRGVANPKPGYWNS